MGFTLDVLSLPDAPADIVAEQIRVTLEKAVDLKGHVLLASAYLMTNAENADSILTNPPMENLPIAYVDYSIQTFTLDMNVQKPVWENVVYRIYVAYNSGVGGDGFNTQKNKHVRALNNALAWNLIGNTGGMTWNPNQWEWDTSQKVVVDDTSPLKFVKTDVVRPKGDAFIVRIDRPALIRMAIA